MPSPPGTTIAIPLQLHAVLLEQQQEEERQTGSRPTYAQIIWRWAVAAGVVKPA
jgi:hypothetical protein